MKKLLRLIKSCFNNDYIFSVISKVLGLFIAIVVSALTARFFGAELKGVMSIVQNDVTLYAVFLGLGIYQAYPFFRKKNPDVMPIYINNITTLFVIYEMVAVIVGGVMIYFNLNVYLAIAILLMPIETYIKQLNYIVLIEHPRRRNLSSLMISITEIVILAVIWIFFEATVVSVLAYYICVVLTNLVISYINLRYNPIKIRISVSQLWSYIKFGFIPMLVYLCMTINYKIDIQMLKWYENVSYADIGIYGTGVALATKIWLVPDAVKDILLSKLVKGKKEEEVAKVIRASLFICIISIVMLILLGKPVVLILYGEEFVNAYYVMLILLVGVLGMIFYKMVYSYNISRGKRVINLIFLGLSAFVNIVGNLILIPICGMWGAAIMSVVSYLVCGVCFLVYFQRVSHISIFKIIFIQKEDFLLVKKLFNK